MQTIESGEESEDEKIEDYGESESSDDEEDIQARAHEHILKDNTWLSTHTDPQDYVPGLQQCCFIYPNKKHCITFLRY